MGEHGSYMYEQIHRILGFDIFSFAVVNPSHVMPMNGAKGLEPRDVPQ